MCCRTSDCTDVKLLWQRVDVLTAACGGELSCELVKFRPEFSRLGAATCFSMCFFFPCASPNLGDCVRGGSCWSPHTPTHPPPHTPHTPTPTHPPPHTPTPPPPHPPTHPPPHTPTPPHTHPPTHPPPTPPTPPHTHPL